MRSPSFVDKHRRSRPVVSPSPFLDKTLEPNSTFFCTENIVELAVSAPDTSVRSEIAEM